MNSDLCVILLRGSADMENHDVMQKHFSEAAEDGHRWAIIDMRHLSFLTSLAIGELLSLNKAKKAKGGHACLCGPNEYVASVISKTRLDQTMKVFGTLDEAIAAHSVIPNSH